MTQPASNPLSASEPWSLVAVGYAETTMQVFEQFDSDTRRCTAKSEGRNRFSYFAEPM